MPMQPCMTEESEMLFEVATSIVQALLFNSCIAEATSLVQYLKDRVTDNQEECPNSPWLALAAMLCFRRRIRTILLPRSFMKLLWDAHPASDAHRLLGQLQAFMKNFDNSLKSAENMIVLSRLDLLQSTVVMSLKHAYLRKERMGLSKRCASATPALLHWRTALRAMVHRCGLNAACVWECADSTIHGRLTLQVVVHSAPEASSRHSRTSFAEDIGTIPERGWNRDTRYKLEHEERSAHSRRDADLWHSVPFVSEASHSRCA